MAVPIMRKLECVCGRLRGKSSHRRGKYVVYEIGYTDKQGEEHINKLKLECLTCCKTKEYEVIQNERKKDKKHKI
jgi:hypothetical protein